MSTVINTQPDAVAADAHASAQPMIEAALAAVRDAQQRVGSVLARAEAVADDTAWRARAADAYRHDNARWREGLRHLGAQLAEREHELQMLRTSAVAGWLG